MTRTMDAALAELKQDPQRIVTAEIDGLIVELHCKGRRSAGDLFREIGPWEGESAEQVCALLREGRTEGIRDVPFSSS